MIKVFTLNANGKIELTKEELQRLLDEAYQDGYNRYNNSFWTYTTPATVPWINTVTCSAADEGINNPKITL